MSEPRVSEDIVVARQIARAELWSQTRWSNLAGHLGTSPTIVGILWGLLDDPSPLLTYLAVSWGLIAVLGVTYALHAKTNNHGPPPFYVYAALTVSNLFLGGGLFLLTPEPTEPSVAYGLGVVIFAGTAGMLVTYGSQAGLMRVALVTFLGAYAAGCASVGHVAIALGTLFFLLVVAGHAVGVVTSTHDRVVDARLRADQRAAEAANALEARRVAQDANDAKTRFLGNMSHELRTPLNVILGYADLADEDLADGMLDEVREDIARVRLAGRQLLSLISDILDLTRIEARQLPMTFRSVALAPELLRVVDLMSAIAAERGNSLTVRLEEGNRLEVWCDADRMRQIVLNLVANANNYTNDGSILLMGRAVANRVRIEVHDTGSGIPPSQLERIFERFSQVDETSTRTHDGAGMGLAISRALARAMQGELSVSSIVGKGSTFVLELPTQSHAAQPAGTTDVVVES
ncbi:MAG: HAMP domain-containing sensor histidine kinase [Myxococcota bacterium]